MTAFESTCPSGFECVDGPYDDVTTNMTYYKCEEESGSEESVIARILNEIRMRDDEEMDDDMGDDDSMEDDDDRMGNSTSGMDDQLVGKVNSLSRT